VQSDVLPLFPRPRRQSPTLILKRGLTRPRPHLPRLHVPRYLNNTSRSIDSSHRQQHHTTLRQGIDSVMRAPSTAALCVLASLCFEQAYSEEPKQNPLTDPRARAKILAACPAYEHYARFPHHPSAKDRSNSLSSDPRSDAGPSSLRWWRR
jgi:hypothetical protein